MPALKEGGYGATFTPVADFSYRVETGPDSSPTYSIETVQPVDLAADSPEITTKPPVYAENTVDQEITRRPGGRDRTSERHGSLRLQVHAARRVRFSGMDADRDEAGEGRRRADAACNRAQPGSHVRLRRVPAAASGKYSLHLRAEHGVPTDFPARDLIVKPDEAPRFKKVVVKEELKAVLPYDRVPLEFTAADDVAVASAEVEYRVNQGDPVREAIAATGLKTREASDERERPEYLRTWRGKSSRAMWLEYRLRISDNLPAEFGGPHVVYYPADHALTLRVATDKEILALRDEINKRLDKIKEDLKAEEHGVAKTRTESREHAALNPRTSEGSPTLKEGQ